MSQSGQAMLEFKEGRYFIGIWFVGDGATQDWMCGVYRDAGETTWHIRYRFRYYKTADAWDGKDTKNRYEGTIANATEADVEAKMHLLATVVSLQFGEISFVPLHSADAAHNAEAMAAQKWSHAKVMTREEAKAAGFDVGVKDKQ